MSYLAFSKRIASYLIKKTGLPVEKESILAYASEVLILNFLNVSLALLIGLFLGVTKGTIICLITVGLIRTFAGGAHSNSPWRCAIITGLLFPALAFIAYKLTGLGQAFTDIFLILSILFGLLTVILCAPSDSPSAPIISNTRRRKLKNLSLTVLLLLSFIVILTRIFNLLNINMQMVFSLSLFWTAFILTPAGIKFFSLIDKLNIKERRGA